MSTPYVVERLAESPILSSLARETLERLASVTVERELDDNEVLFTAGTRRRAIYLVVTGRVELSHELHDQRDLSVLLYAGDEIGEAMLLGPSRHIATARAVGGATLLELTRDAIREVLADDVEGRLELISSAAQKVSSTLQYSSTRHLAPGRVHHVSGERVERDLLGERTVPNAALYGVQTVRAMENFPITGIRLSHFPAFVRALAMVKKAAARVNVQLEQLDPRIGKAIEHACQEVISGRWHGHFVVDMVQGGAGTSTNMNANEVLANRALELLGKERGEYEACHPNNHVNLAQSTNDVYPTAMRIALVLELRRLTAALVELKSAFEDKAREFANVIKMGRTQLQDAVPMTLGQELAAMAETVGEDVMRLGEAGRLCHEVNIGGTAIGTGITTDPKYAELMVHALRHISGLKLELAGNLVEATPDTGAFVSFSGTIKRVAIKLSKLCNDLRLLSSGPRCGLNEINLPAVQPGSSIMPGKVNPVIPEVVSQVAYQVIGNDLAVALAAEAGQLQLNAMEPIIAFNLFQSLEMLASAIETLTVRCVRGITANAEHCREMVEGSIGIVTAIVPALGYERASEVAKEAARSGRSVRQVLLDGDYGVTAEEVDDLLSVESMTRPRPLPRRR